jgi:hypothetical protein
MSAHTPGPWHVGNTNSGNVAIFAEVEHRQPGYSEACICAVSPICDATHEDYANARLLSSAPDLLEALQELLNQFDSEIHNEYDGTGMLNDRLSEANHARRVVAKAKGETL